MPWSELLLNLDHNVECTDLGLNFNKQKLIEDVKAIGRHYVQKPAIQTISGLYGKNKKSWLGIPLRNVGGDESPEGLKIGESPNVSSMDCQDTDYMNHCPYIKRVLYRIKEELGTEIGQVRVLKLKVGGKLRPHLDYPRLFPEKRLRLHIPIITKSSVKTVIGNTKIYLEPAKLYYFAAQKLHSVRNESNIDRVHLIIDIKSTNKARKFILNKNSE